MTRRPLLLLLLLLAPAASADTVSLSLDEALERARAASARLGELRALERGAAAAVGGARAQRLPSLGLAAGYSRNSDVPEFVAAFPGEGPRTIFPNLPNQGYARATANLPLYTGGRIEGQIASTRRQSEAARLDVAAGESDLVYETTSAYWSLVEQRASERVLREAIASYESHLKDAQNRFDTGVAARNDLLAVQVERDRAELARLEAEAGASLAEANLVRLLDLPVDARVEPTSSRADEAAAPVDLAPLVTRALETRPELAALRARAEAAEAAVGTARAGARPQAGLQGSYEYSNPNTRIFPLEGDWRDTWSVGVSVSITAFDGGRTKAAAAQAQAQADAARQALADLERRVRLEVTARLLDIRTAGASLAVARRTVEAARENVKVNRDRYQEGVSLSSDLLDAESQLLRASLDETRSTTALLVARAGLERAVGR